mmetsp:Transcript_73729/g.146163  ORF Transcript_73729/g.146163 Transcript_73729/m.146163 type:complete len:224 (-) Transcript_73729:54-725(-)
MAVHRVACRAAHKAAHRAVQHKVAAVRKVPVEHKLVADHKQAGHMVEAAWGPARKVTHVDQTLVAQRQPEPALVVRGPTIRSHVVPGLHLVVQVVRPEWPWKALLCLQLAQAEARLHHDTSVHSHPHDCFLDPCSVGSMWGRWQRQGDHSPCHTLGAPVRSLHSSPLHAAHLVLGNQCSMSSGRRIYSNRIHGGKAESPCLRQPAPWISRFGCCCCRRLCCCR